APPPAPTPRAAGPIRKAGFDVCSHGWRWIKHFDLTRQAERQHIARAIASFQKTIGERPLGWYWRYGPGVSPRERLVEEGGFLYDSDAYNDELPYWVTVKGRGHLVVPYSLTNNDGKYAGWTGTSEQWFSFVKDAFDMLLREGARHPKMMSIGLHMRLIGHPTRRPPRGGGGYASPAGRGPPGPRGPSIPPATGGRPTRPPGTG